MEEIIISTSNFTVITFKVLTYGTKYITYSLLASDDPQSSLERVEGARGVTKVNIVMFNVSNGVLFFVQ